MKSLIIISGPAGAGKSTALHVLEDLGYFGIDNLPLSLLDDLVDEKLPFMDHVAVVMDGRDPHFAVKGIEAIKKVHEQGVRTGILFQTADDMTVSVSCAGLTLYIQVKYSALP